MEFTPKQRRLLDRATEVFGVEHQWRMTQEECGELIVAINHNLRGRGSVDAVIEEIADVLIMVEQAMRMLCRNEHLLTNSLPGEPNRVEHRVEQKLERLEQRLFQRLRELKMLQDREARK